MKPNPERLRYKNDKASANLVFGAIAFDIAYFLLIYSSFTIVPNILVGADIIINILFMLIAFWASEMVKVYQKKWAIGLIIMAVIQILRVFWLPASYSALGQLTGSTYTFVIGSLVLSAACLILAALRSYRLSTILENYFAELASASKEVH